jgi:AmmeMemoRadiSam system protein A
LSFEASVTPDQAELLLDTAELAIRARVAGTPYPGPDVELLPERLQQAGGAFVTLHVDGQLNGCIGNVGGDEPLGASVSRLAIQAAFEDPRLPQLRRRDLPGLHLEISLLSPRTEVPASTRDELLEHLAPGVHGLQIASGRRRAIFLPAVWAQLADRDDFLDQLLRKADLSTTDWPNDMCAEVFTTHSFGRRLPRAAGLRRSP